MSHSYSFIHYLLYLFAITLSTNAFSDDAVDFEHIELATEIYFGSTCHMEYFVHRRRGEQRAFYYGNDGSGKDVCGAVADAASQSEAEQLAQKKCEDAKIRSKSTAECAAFMIGDRMVADLENLGIDLDPNAMLLVAMRDDRQQSIPKLISIGASHDVSSDTGLTPMLMALSYRNNELVEILLDKGATFEDQTKSGLRAVHFAAQGNRPELIEKVISSGAANINAQDNEFRMTPLHYAVSKQAAKSIRWLLSNGADDSLLDAEGISAKDRLAELAERNGETIESYYPK